jgi:hypothetical protein
LGRVRPRRRYHVQRIHVGLSIPILRGSRGPRLNRSQLLTDAWTRSIVSSYTHTLTSRTRYPIDPPLTASTCSAHVDPVFASNLRGAHQPSSVLKSIARVSPSPRHRLPRRRRPLEPPLTHPTISRAGSCPSPHANAQQDTVTRTHRTLALDPSMAAIGTAPHRLPSRLPPAEETARAPVSFFFVL